MEEAHADVHKSGAVVGVEWGRVRDGLDACADATNGVGVDGGLLGSDASSRHGGGWHGRLSSGQNYAAAIVEAEDAGYAVGAVIDRGAEWGGERGHVLRGEGFVGWPKRCIEAIKGIRYGAPFCLRFGEGSIERLVV